MTGFFPHPIENYLYGVASQRRLYERGDEMTVHTELPKVGERFRCMLTGEAVRITEITEWGRTYFIRESDDSSGAALHSEFWQGDIHQRYERVSP